MVNCLSAETIAPVLKYNWGYLASAGKVVCDAIATGLAVSVFSPYASTASRAEM